MTTRPYLTAFAACIAGMVFFGVLLAGLALGLAWDWWVLKVAGLGLFVFLWVVARGITVEHGYLTAQKQADLDTQRQSTAERAASLEARLAAAIIATDDAAPTTADLPKLERRREVELAHWHIFHRRLVAAGCALGWTRDNLTAGPVKVVTQPAWNIGTNNLQAAGYLFKDGAGSRLLVSEADWNAGRLWEHVPAPDGAPPDILPPPYNSATTRPNNGQTAAGAVIDMPGKG